MPSMSSWFAMLNAAKGLGIVDDAMAKADLAL